ncbi:MAG: hypothetical protein V8R16_07320 [Bacilli bacterium]
MENLFNYATKELSQDAFLMWLMANYNCEEDKQLKDASRKFICKLFEINNVDINENDILNVEVYPQENKSIFMQLLMYKIKVNMVFLLKIKHHLLNIINLLNIIRILKNKRY